jgi:hypothetical protein
MLYSQCKWVVVALLWASLEQLLYALTSPTSRPNNLLILGLGRVGYEIAQQARGSGCFDGISGTVRKLNVAEKYDSTKFDESCHQILFEETAKILETAQRCSHILISIPPSNDEERNAELDELFQRIVNKLPAYCWIGVLSTTGVYGNHNGEWVSEKTKCDAVSPSAKRYLIYEDSWKEKANQHQLYIFRCAGIYGGGQSALHSVFKNGLPPMDLRNDSDVTNRIHVHDLAASVLASMQRYSADPSRREGLVAVYNLADDMPESRTVVMTYAAGLLQRINITISKVSQDATSVRSQRRQTDQKRVCNKKIKGELLRNPLKFPTYKEGLEYILEDRNNPWWPGNKG